jgi:hypothetical protein
LKQMYAKAKCCLVLKKLPDLEMVFIDFADLLRRIDRNDQKAMQVLAQMHTEPEILGGDE